MTSSQVAAALRLMADQIDDAADNTESYEFTQGFNRFTPGVGPDTGAFVLNMDGILTNPYLTAFTYDLRPLKRDMSEISTINGSGRSLEELDLDSKISTAYDASRLLRDTVTGLEMVYYSLRYYQQTRYCIRDGDDNVFADDMDHENLSVRLANHHAHAITESNTHASTKGIWRATDGTCGHEARVRDTEICLRRMQAAIQELETFYTVTVDYLNTLQKASVSQKTVDLVEGSDATDY